MRVTQQGLLPLLRRASSQSASRVPTPPYVHCRCHLPRVRLHATGLRNCTSRSSRPLLLPHVSASRRGIATVRSVYAGFFVGVAKRMRPARAISWRRPRAPQPEAAVAHASRAAQREGGLSLLCASSAKHCKPSTSTRLLAQGCALKSLRYPQVHTHSRTSKRRAHARIRRAARGAVTLPHFSRARARAREPCHAVSLAAPAALHASSMYPYFLCRCACLRVLRAWSHSACAHLNCTTHSGPTRKSLLEQGFQNKALQHCSITVPAPCHLEAVWQSAQMAVTTVATACNACKRAGCLIEAL